jgi:hypothetical protein
MTAQILTTKILSLTFALALSVSAVASAEIVSIGPSKDNTLIQATNPNAQLSNGLGDIFTGRTNQDGQGAATISIRRGLAQFDIAGSIPAGSTITGVTLTMRDVMGLNGDPSVELHRVLADWGEGTSFQAGGMGAAATQDDATWLYRFYNAANPAASPAWNSAGGDFSPTVSAASIISDDLGGGQSFSWSGAGLIADVQSFLDNPSSNFGWLLFGDESRGQSAKRLNSSESFTPPNLPPILAITYVVPEPSSLMLVLAAAGCVLGARFRRRAA